MLQRTDIDSGNFVRVPSDTVYGRITSQQAQQILNQDWVLSNYNLIQT
ncbi:hypothetical protein SP19_59 [Salmonella phage 19]|nr:hypothetical protein SP19_59 [Salmonella phage 19]